MFALPETCLNQIAETPQMFVNVKTTCKTMCDILGDFRKEFNVTCTLPINIPHNWGGLSNEVINILSSHRDVSRKWKRGTDHGYIDVGLMFGRKEKGVHIHINNYVRNTRNTIHIMLMNGELIKVLERDVDNDNMNYTEWWKNHNVTIGRRFLCDGRFHESGLVKVKHYLGRLDAVVRDAIMIPSPMFDLAFHIPPPPKWKPKRFWVVTDKKLKSNILELDHDCYCAPEDMFLIGQVGCPTNGEPFWMSMENVVDPHKFMLNGVLNISSQYPYDELFLRKTLLDAYLAEYPKDN